MGSGLDGHLLELVEIKVPDIEGFAVFQLHVELLVEVAVKDFAHPVDADGVAAHQSFNGARVEILDEQLVVFVELFVALEIGSVTRDRHIGDAVEIVEFDVEVLLHLTLVGGLKLFLVGGKESAIGIVDKIEPEFRVDTVAQLVELLESGDGAVKNIVATLLIDVVGRVAGHGGDTDDLVLGVEFGDPLITGLLNDSGIEAGHHGAGLVEIAHALDELAEVRVHLRSSACQVQGRNVRLLEPVDGAIEVLGGDEFFPVRTCIHVAVDAGDVTKFAQIQLENGRLETGEAESVIGELLVERVFWLGGGAHEIC